VICRNCCETEEVHKVLQIQEWFLVGHRGLISVRLAIITTVNNREETTITDYDVKVPGRMLSSLMTEKGGFSEVLVSG